MAKVTNPLFSSEARGRVGGIIYNTWRGLATVKCKIAPSQPRTARQLAVRAFLTTLSKAWKSQSDANRALWNAYAVEHPRTDWSGSRVRSTGLDWFIALNTRRLDQGLALVATPPIVDGPANVAAGVLTGGAGTLSLAFTAYPAAATQIECYLYGPRSAGVIPKFTKAKFKSRGPGETSPFVVTALAAGLYTAWYRGLSETDGQASAFVEFSATVT